ncbi:hypothetical protein [Lactiplantibacillus plantarum]|uniref:hypothetical protein n=1 Tax=Lactiplantibacillus plantarum TaxID=1590 RepID=UPI000975A9BF|nr:hypothetical protein [Lactiplantibacillus plantarum]
MRNTSKLSNRLKQLNKQFTAIQGNEDMVTIFCEEQADGSVVMGNELFKDMKHFEAYLNTAYSGKDLIIFNDDLQPDE